jgi:hypothetical protein
MKYLKTFESYSVNEEENIFKAIGGFFGKYNEDTRMRAENAMNEWNNEHPGNRHGEVFNQLREAYDNNSGVLLPAQKGSPFNYDETELSAEDVKKLLESALFEAKPGVLAELISELK